MSLNYSFFLKIYLLYKHYHLALKLEKNLLLLQKKKANANFMYSRMFVFFLKEAMAKKDDSVSIDNKDRHNPCYNYSIVFKDNTR